jgi:hypothetical protein
MKNKRVESPSLDLHRGPAASAFDGKILGQFLRTPEINFEKLLPCCFFFSRLMEETNMYNSERQFSECLNGVAYIEDTNWK